MSATSTFQCQYLEDDKRNTSMSHDSNMLILVLMTYYLSEKRFEKVASTA